MPCKEKEVALQTAIERYEKRIKNNPNATQAQKVKAKVAVIMAQMDLNYCKLHNNSVAELLGLFDEKSK